MEFKDIIGEKEIPKIDLIIEKTKLEPKIRKLDVLNNSEDIFY